MPCNVFIYFLRDKPNRYFSGLYRILPRRGLLNIPVQIIPRIPHAVANLDELWPRSAPAPVFHKARVDVEVTGGLFGGQEAGDVGGVVERQLLGHKLRNIGAKVPDERSGEVLAHARAAYQAISPMAARNAADEFRRFYANEFPSAVACFEDDFEACIAHLRLPVAQRKSTRTTNLLERLFGEERRRTKVIPHAFGERAVLKLMFAALVRASQSWRRITISEFEQRQLADLRLQLRTESTAHVTHHTQASLHSISSKSKT